MYPYPVMPWHKPVIRDGIRPVFYESLRLSVFSTTLLKERVLLYLQSVLSDDLQEELLSYPPQVCVAYSYMMPNVFFDKMGGDLEFNLETKIEQELDLHNMEPHIYYDPAGNATLSIRFNNAVLERMFENNIRNGCTWEFDDVYRPYINLFKEDHRTRGFVKKLYETMKGFKDDFSHDKYLFDRRRIKIIIEEIRDVSIDDDIAHLSGNYNNDLLGQSKEESMTFEKPPKRIPEVANAIEDIDDDIPF